MPEPTAASSEPPSSREPVKYRFVLKRPPISVEATPVPPLAEQGIAEPLPPRQRPGRRRAPKAPPTAAPVAEEPAVGGLIEETRAFGRCQPILLLLLFVNVIAIPLLVAGHVIDKRSKGVPVLGPCDGSRW